MARILVVDTESSIRISLGEFLKDADYEVSVAEDAEKAIDMLVEDDFDVVLSDIILPRFTGVSLLKAVRETSPHVQVFLMTGEPTIETASEAVRAGAFDYLTKPIGKEQLLKTVANAVKVKFLDDERRRLTEENRQYQKNLERLVEERTTGLREKEQQLFQAQKMDSLGTLVSGVAHEINNPISLIMFNVPLLQSIWQDFQPIMEERAKKEPGRKYGGLKYSYIKEKLNQLLSDMEMASNRIANIVNNLKNFSRQTDIAEKKPMPINEAVKNAIKLSQTTLRKSNVALDLELGHDLPLLEGNMQGIEQIVLNLIINATQAIKHSHGKINIITEFQKEKNQIIVSISDNGKGVDPSISEKIFDPFVTNKQAEGGTGLGLSVTYSLVSAHSGHITFKSEKGKETIFTVCFPIGQDEIAAKILLVDDEIQIRNMLKQTLAKRQSLLVEDADNGIDGWIKLGSFHPDLLILDLNMPKMDGLEVCRTIKNDPNLSSVKVMILTGYPDDPKVKQVAELGFKNIFTKPMIAADFLKEIDNILLQPTRVII